MERNPADLSPGMTVVAFDPIVPPVRVPIPAGEDDNPSIGKWVLAFKDEDSWRGEWNRCERKISEQCKMGARMGCSIKAAKACEIPWWKHALIFMKAAKLQEGESDGCEEKVMMACVASSEEDCTKYARGICQPVFEEARIAGSNVPLDPRFASPRFGRKWTRDMMQQSVHELSGNYSDSVGSEQDADHDFKPFEISTLLKSTNYRGKLRINGESMGRSSDAPTFSQTTVNSDNLK